MYRPVPLLIVVAVVTLAGCTDRRPQKKTSCNGRTDVQLTLALSTNLDHPLVAFNQAEFVADRTVRFTNFCDVVEGGNPETQCTESQAPQRHVVRYPDGSPFDKVTLRVYNRSGALVLEKTGHGDPEELAGDDCLGYSEFFGIRYVKDPPGITDAGDDASDSNEVSAD